MKPDSPTIFLAGTAICGAVAFLQFSISTRTQSPTLRVWAWSNLAFCLGFAFQAALPVLPLVVAGFFGDEMLILGALLVVAGIDVFAGRRLGVLELVGGMGLTAATLALSLSMGDRYGERAIIISTAIAWCGARAAWALLRLPHRRTAGVRRTCAAIILAFAMFYLFRGIGLYVGVLDTTAAVSDTRGGITRLFAIATVVVWAFGSLYLALDREASVDTLTGLLNRRAATTSARRLVREAAKARHPLSVLMIDLDHFKDVNDRFGHQAGDLVLRAFATVALGTVRADDIVGRLGGEEFCIALPRSNARQAVKVAERLRVRCEQTLGQTLREPVPVTISTGVATLTPANANFLRLLKEADQALYEAKALGRNRVVCARSAGGQAVDRFVPHSA